MWALLVGACVLAAGCGETVVTPPRLDVASATFVGRQSCERCHTEETARWVGSHHDRAMELPDETSILGDFDDATFTAFGVRTTFFRRDGGYWVRTESETGDLQDYPIAYTFGFYPLQQYLVEFPGGRLQALGIAWDSRPSSEGGQRWFHLYPGERIQPGDSLHWTGADQNWNYMCAECHSTDLVKNYDAEAGTYATTFAEVDVSCEACHGPASMHLEWAEANARGEELDGGPWKGLPLSLGPGDPPDWTISEETGIAVRNPPLDRHREVEACARCHARRSTLIEPYEYGRALTDTHDLSLLRAGLYWPDGQVRDEVYVYGSFIQSRMHAKGVTCQDCHDPHSTGIYSTGNALCNRCHAAGKYDTPDHHFHTVGAPGSACVDCHMPETTYMVVDPRRDHSMRIPRPDLNVELGIPDACTGCHADRGPEWNAAAVERWYGPSRRDDPHYGEILAAARRGDPAAGVGLVALAEDFEKPGIVRATALSMLESFPSPAALDAISRALGDGDPIVRAGAVEALVRADPQIAYRLAYPLLRDANRSVRINAARVLANVPLARVTPEAREAIMAAVDERITALRTNAERFEAQINIGVLYAQTGRPLAAEEAYRRAIELAPREPSGYVNLADLYRAQQRDAEGEVVLRQALAAAPESPTVHHAMGLLLVRRGRTAAAVESLETAYRLAPDNPRYALAYALGLQQRGDLAGALQVLREGHRLAPADTDILLAAIEVARGTGRLDEARDYAARLLELVPGDESVRALVRELEQ